MVASANPGERASIITGIATTTMRTSDVAMEGSVFPIAWNMLPVTKTTPDARKLHDTIRRYQSRWSGSYRIECAHG